ncbi:hypothetical protein BO71DRAFT_379178 [Aspergillus ellipticus CBS 707.79]|uniref:SMP-30/Gluconolactonase/LRE-like region domain-containing protein n=1 Tax=Aspergillus ellipticus CBS 707.79 TaxID=1448320 RepID=A0A319DBE3_9EURO|nr:hypothetical protein BO71DRAFT_379178 [Aspergillus ellipticus CBS 707.79]
MLPQTLLLWLTGLLLTTHAALHHPAPPTPSPPPATATPIYQFHGNNTWAENLAIRPSGDILVTRVDVPELWHIHPTTGTGNLLHRFPHATALMGITEISPDVFALAVGNATTTGHPVAGSWSIWTVDMNSRIPRIKELLAIPDAEWPNGVGRMDGLAGVILVADCVKGVVFKVDVGKRTYEVTLQDPTMAMENVIGINGVHGYEGHVYYSSTAKRTLYRIPVDHRVRATGPAETVLADTGVDDFAIAPDGTFYLMIHAGNQVLKLGRDNEVTVLVGHGNGTDVAGPTGGQVTRDGRVLYVSTCGACGGDSPWVEQGAEVLSVRLWG